MAIPTVIATTGRVRPDWQDLPGWTTCGYVEYLDEGYAPALIAWNDICSTVEPEAKDVSIIKLAHEIAHNLANRHFYKEWLRKERLRIKPKDQDFPTLEESNEIRFKAENITDKIFKDVAEACEAIMKKRA